MRMYLDSIFLSTFVLLSGCSFTESDDISGGDEIDAGVVDLQDDTNEIDMMHAQYQYVLLEDQSIPAGGTPGTAVDAVVLEKKDGRRIAATHVVNSYDPSDYNESVVSNIIGEPDFSCELPPDDGLYSLGGDGGWVILSFGGVAIENGDHLDVFTLFSEEPCSPAFSELELDIKVGGVSDYEDEDEWVVLAVNFPLEHGRLDVVLP